ncbi:Glycosyltransferase [Rhynchospora pubera]|uniref:Glycosyltransferase n=1 Tax=Rhynchospora pubera TaxID=906938 RepID=A0AAV8EHC5_9POAL|nr:Glycosyltransferase [Rhynchospora pubera]
MLHVSDLPIRIVQFDTEEHKLLMDIYRRMSKAKGILINTFELLEHGAVKTLKDWLSLSNPPTPRAYCIGPLVTAADNKEIVNHPCLRWLDYQRKESVVLLAFWELRNPESNYPDRKPYNPLAEPDLDALLPEGFMNRTKEQGIVMKSWAPQVEILHHEAVGGFVNHCGWSSILEAITNGVPIICWPLFAEQKMNRFLLAEEMKIGVKLKGCDEGFVSRDE